MVDAAEEAGAPVRRGDDDVTVETVAGVTTTLGGLAIDEHAQVTRGIFACGADAGGIATGGYASGLAAALVFGRMAARAALGRDSVSDPAADRFGESPDFTVGLEEELLLVDADTLQLAHVADRVVPRSALPRDRLDHEAFLAEIEVRSQPRRIGRGRDRAARGGAHGGDPRGRRGRTGRHDPRRRPAPRRAALRRRAGQVGALRARGAADAGPDQADARVRSPRPRGTAEHRRGGRRHERHPRAAAAAPRARRELAVTGSAPTPAWPARAPR